MKETPLLFVRFDQSKLMGWMTMMTTFPNIINKLGEAVGRLTDCVALSFSLQSIQLTLC